MVRVESGTDEGPAHGRLRAVRRRGCQRPRLAQRTDALSASADPPELFDTVRGTATGHLDDFPLYDPQPYPGNRPCPILPYPTTNPFSTSVSDIYGRALMVNRSGTCGYGDVSRPSARRQPDRAPAAAAHRRTHHRV
jgi:hypothetical protein